VVAQNASDGRNVAIEPAMVKLLVHGSNEALQALDGDALRPHVDLTDLKPGRYTLPVQVDAAANRVEVVRIEPAAVEVRIF
jgi:hypothetical protein